jgi:hypothetical protein
MAIPKLPETWARVMAASRKIKKADLCNPVDRVQNGMK